MEIAALSFKAWGYDKQCKDTLNRVERQTFPVILNFFEIKVQKNLVV